MRSHFERVRLVLALVSLGAAIGALFIDQLSGADSARVGTVQALGTLVALSVFAAAVAWRQPAISRGAIDARMFRWTFCAAIAAASFGLHAVSPTTAGPWLVTGYAIAVALVLPLRFGLAGLGICAATGILLSSISQVKVLVSGMPLTMLDIRVAVVHPEGLRKALALPAGTMHAVAVVAGLAMVALLLAGLSDVKEARRRRGVRHDRSWFFRAAAAVVLSIAGYTHLDAASRYVDAHEDAWRPAGLAGLAEEVGIAAFLFHSARLESRDRGPIFAADTLGVRPIEASEVHEAVRSYITFDASLRGTRPNILVVLSESSFDPGRAFHLEGRWDERLFRPNAATNLFTELRVNAIGGGTWISEFETIVGLDSRLFGYYGFYAHAAVSPFIAGSLATHLKERGYRTLAFFPHLRNLYSAERAYERYGFEDVRDSRDLWNITDRWVRDDRLIASTVRSHLTAESPAPFLAYVKLVENHWPHPCDTEPLAEFDAVFAGSSDHASNCALDVFLRRMVATADAVDSLRAHMIDLERQTGRPYVLLNFGDHQPHIFTGTTDGGADVDQFRTAKDPYTTYAHFESSLPLKIECCTQPLPIAALPTIVSAYAADGAEDVYMGENLWLYAKCGSDAFRAWRQEGVPASSHDVECRQSFRRAVASFRQSAVVRLN